MVHVPYKGAAPAMQDVIAGHVDFMFDASISALPQIMGGKVRAIALSGTFKLLALPDLPSVSSEVPGFDVTGWQGFLAPRGTPAGIVSRWQREIEIALNTPRVKDRLTALGYEVVASKPADFLSFLSSEREKYGRIIREAKITAD
jgi:tripartite-type tricarboxylate transporter receptor subunit TctC